MVENLAAARVDGLESSCRLFLEILEVLALVGGLRTSKWTRLVTALAVRVVEAAKEVDGTESLIAERSLAAVGWSKHLHRHMDNKRKIADKYSKAGRIDQHRSIVVGQTQVLVAEIEIDCNYLYCWRPSAPVGSFERKILILYLYSFLRVWWHISTNRA